MAKIVSVSKACTIKEALEAASIEFEHDDIFCYEVQKKESVSAGKMVALIKDGDKNPLLGDVARSKVGLPIGAAGTVTASDVPSGFKLFVQSTSHNRKMPAGASVMLLTKGASDAKVEDKAIVEKAGKLPVCPYGEKCYRKNPEHFSEYAHPWLHAKKTDTVALETKTSPVEEKDHPPAKRSKVDAASASSPAEEKDEPPSKRSKMDTASASSASTAAPVATDSSVWQDIGSVSLKDFGSLASERVAAFDMDSTIINTKSGKTFALSKDDWVLWSPEHVPKKLKQLHNEGYKVVLITNQGGIQKGKTKLADIQSKIDAVQKAVAVPWLAVILTKDDLYRKPLPTVWSLIEKSFNGGVKFSKADSFYCGDAAGRVPPVVTKKDFSDGDLKFALNIGIRFFTPEECFLGKAQKYDTDFKFDPRKLGVDTKPFPVPALKKQTLVLCVGPPASGKSSIATKHLVGCARVNQDTLKTKEKCHKACEAALKEGKSVIVDNQNKGKADRAPYLALAKKAGVAVIAIRVDVPKELCFHLNSYRMLNVKSDLHRAEKVPSMVIHSFYKNVEEPDTKEGFEQVFKVGLEHFVLQGDVDLDLMRSFID